MTPKGLLRLKEASSTLDDLATGTFRPVLDADVPDKAAIRRLVLCTGKVYYDIVGHAERAGRATRSPWRRLEQLYPFPVEAARELVASYPALDEIVWAQEEPQNMGAWRSIRHRLEEAAGGAPVRYVGPPVARVHGRGLPDGAHARARAHRARRSRFLTRSSALAPAHLAPNDRPGPCLRKRW